VRTFEIRLAMVMSVTSVLLTSSASR